MILCLSATINILAFSLLLHSRDGGLLFCLSFFLIVVASVLLGRKMERGGKAAREHALGLFCFSTL